MTDELGAPWSNLGAPVSIAADHDVADFDCGAPALDAWLKGRALKNESVYSRTYVVCDGAKVIAFFCISAGSVRRDAAPGRRLRNAPDTIPVAILGRLAVSRLHSSRGLGADLLSDALRRIAAASRTIGIAALLVQAKADAARRFYLRHAEFIEFPADSRTLYLPIEMITAALIRR